MAEEDIGFGSYKMGVAADLKQPAFIGLDQGINWGAPSVEVQGEMGRIGKSGVEALKNLAAANKVDVSWHVPPAENFELAVPDKKLNERAMKSIEVGIEHAANAGMKLINTHPTQVIPRVGEDEMYIFDKESGRLSRVPVPKDEKGEHNKGRYLEFLNDQKKNQVEDQIAWGNHYTEQFKNVLDRIAPLKEALEKGYDLKKHPKLYIEANKAIDRSLDSFGSKEKMKEYVEKKYNEYHSLVKTQKKKSELNKRYYDRWLKEGFIEDGKRAINDNLINNMSKVAKKAVDKGITFAIENTDERFMYSTPQELNQVVSGIKEKLRGMGVPQSKIDKHVGVTFDMGHAATMQDFTVKDEKTGKEIKIGPPSEFLKSIKHDIKEVHAVESFGDVDSHLPLGEAFSEEERKRMEDFLKKHAEDPRVISEGVAQGSTGPGFAYGMQNITGLYSVAGTPTNMMWGPTYMSSSFDEGLFMPGDKREHYFYSSFTGGLF